MPKSARRQNREKGHTQTHRTTTVTLLAHECRGLLRPGTHCAVYMNSSVVVGVKLSAFKNSTFSLCNLWQADKVGTQGF